MVFVTSPFNSVLQSGELELRDLATYPLLLPSGRSVTREILVNSLQANGLDPSSSLLVVIDCLDCAQRLAKEGRGIALIHISYVQDETASGRLKIVPVVDDIRVGADLLIHKSIPLPLMASKFAPILREAFHTQRPATQGVYQ